MISMLTKIAPCINKRLITKMTLVACLRKSVPCHIYAICNYSVYRWYRQFSWWKLSLYDIIALALQWHPMGVMDMLHKSPYPTLYAHFSYKIAHCGIFVWRIVEFVRWVCSLAFPLYFQTLVQDNDKEDIKFRITDPLCRGIHRWPVGSPHKGPEMQKAFPCYDVIMWVGPSSSSHLCLRLLVNVKCYALV